MSKKSPPLTRIEKMRHDLYTTIVRHGLPRTDEFTDLASFEAYQRRCCNRLPASDMDFVDELRKRLPSLRLGFFQKKVTGMYFTPTGQLVLYNF